MPWFKVDDSFGDHAKVMAAGNAAVGLWVRAGAWSARQLMDGYVPEQVALSYGTRALARRLVEVGLWRKVEGGYMFHGWDQWQPSRAEVQAMRRRKADGGAFGNHLRWHVARGIKEPSCQWCQGADQ